MIRLAVRVESEFAELVLAELLELAPAGVEEVSDTPGVVEYAVYGAAGELPSLPELRAAAGGALVDISTREVGEDFAERWREFHRPLRLGALSVRPPWEPPQGAELEVVIDPGRAFGTGAHATTRLCLELLLEQPVSHGGAFVDLGCGSGVLSIVAAKLGWQPVLALDHDPVCLDATRANARVNGVALEARRLDMRSEVTPPAALMAANVLSGPLRAWAKRIDELPARLILSGILTSEVKEVLRAFSARGFSELERRQSGEWSALLLASGS